MLALIDHPRAAGEVFNVGHSREVSIEQLAHLIRELADSTSPIVYVPYDEAYGGGFEDMQRRVPDVSKLRCFTGIAPAIPLEEALVRIITAERSAEARD
jgi:UDP-glucose 4-epimerase